MQESPFDYCGGIAAMADSSPFRPALAWTRWALALTCVAIPHLAANAQGRRPNILVIITDDQRWNTLGIAGHPQIKTPNIDRLGKQGVYFKNAFCTTSLCSPSRASILSGLYAHRHGVRDNFTDFPRTLTHFPARLRAAGYITAYIGKWHMGEDDDTPRPGFDFWASHKGQGKYFDNEFFIQDRRQVLKGYYTTAVTDLAADWIAKRKKDTPFCMVLGHKAPHSFYVPEPKYEKAFDHVKVEYPKSAFALDTQPEWIKTRRTTWHGIYGPLFEFRKKFPDERPEAVADFQNMVRSYMATILSVDDSVGRLLKTLEDEGILDDTIIVFMADNGLLEGEHGMVDKRTMHEPSIRVPLVVRYPGLAAPEKAKTVDKMVLHIDIAPSLLELCGAKPLENIQGKSWVKLVRKGDDAWRTAWLYEYNYEKQFPYTPNIRGVRTDDFSYMHYPHGDGSPDRHKAELYDLRNDPDQLKNLVGVPRQEATLDRMRNELARVVRELNLTDDKMPIDAGIKQTLPDLKIR